MKPTLSLSVVVLLGCVSSGCATTGEVRAGDGSPTTTLALSRRDYLNALDALRVGDYAASMEGLQKVARGPSYIVYSPLARLRFADALLYQEKFDEAGEAYRAFIETNSGDPNLHYAYFRLAESKVKSLAGDFFLVPPADRRDQKKVRSSLAALQDFVNRYPDSPYVLEATAMLNRMTGIVTSFEMEVADFYTSRDKPGGAVSRIRRLMAEVPRAARLEDTRVAYVKALAAAGQAEALARECEAYRELFPAGWQRTAVASLCPRPAPDAGALPN